VEGNFIGTDVTGTGSLPNYRGIQITDASGNTIGGTTAGARNLISGNNTIGVMIVGGTATGNRVQGNYIGTDVNGIASLGNDGPGIVISDARNNVIGGTTVAARNLISGNFVGILIVGLGASGNRVEGNLIGTNVNGTAALPNGAGVDIFSTSGNTLGGTMAGARNLISGNGFNGVSIFDNREEELVQGNYIGTDLTGTAKIPNGRNGVQIESATQATIGGTAAGAGNLVSGNNEDGVIIEDGSISTTVQGNFIGTDATGQLALGNGTGGVGIVGSWQNTIGGTDFGAGNLISGNGGSGLVIQDGNVAAMTNTVQGNIIGLAADGMHRLGNELNGVFVMASGNTIGGTTAGARNVISANERGIYISAATGNLVQGNYIGTDISGSLKRGNVGVGLRIEDSVTNTVRDNVIAGNGAEGIDVPGSSGNVLQANRIGVSATGDGDLGNGGDGILLEGTSSHNLIGGGLSTLGNIIAHNGGNGVTVGGTINDTAVANTISHNSIYANALLGIDLGNDGVTANDAGDNDTGPNGLQNVPVLTATLSSSDVIVIQGTLNSVPNTNMTLEFFSNRVCDPSGYGEGEGFLGPALVTTDAGGNASFDAAFARSLLTGAFASATATDPSGNTSEFSRCVQVAVLKVYLPLVAR
jgi:titin